MAPKSAAALLERDGQFMMVRLLQLMAQFIAWGIFLIVFVFAVYCMSMRPVKNRAWTFMLVVMIFLFAMSTLHHALGIMNVFMQVDRVLLRQVDPALGGEVTTSKAVVVAVYLINWIPPLMFIIGDGVVVWRTWVLCEGSRILLFPVVLLVGAFATLVVARILYITSGGFAANMIGRDLGGGHPELVALTFAFSGISNLVCTGMIAYKAWQYHKAIKDLGRSSRTIVERVFILLVESGLIYIIFWGSSSVINVRPSYGPLLIFQTVWLGMGSQILAMYPTAIIALVELQRSLHNEYEQVSLPTISSLSPFAKEISSDPNEPRMPMTYAVGFDVDLNSDRASDSFSEHLDMPRGAKLQKETYAL